MSQPQFKLNKIGLVMLGVTDMAKSIAFYNGQLGLTIQGQSPEFSFLDGGSVTLALSPLLTQGGRRGAGAAEVVFSVEHVRTAYEALRTQGVSFVNEPRIATGAMWVVNFRDPDGHELSLFGPE